MIHNWFADLGMRYKLFLLTIALIFIPFVMYTGITMYQSSRELERFGSYTAGQVLQQTGLFVQFRVQTVKRALDFMTLSTTIREYSNTDPAVYAEGLSRWNVDAIELRKIIYGFVQNNPDIRSFTLYMGLGLGSVPASDESKEFRPLDPERQSSWFLRTQSRNQAFWWFPPSLVVTGSSPDYFHAFRRIPDDQNLQNIVGFVRADLPVAMLEEMLDKAEFSSSSYAYIVNSYNELIAVSGRARIHPKERLDFISVGMIGEAPAASSAAGASSSDDASAPATAEAFGIGGQVFDVVPGVETWKSLNIAGESHLVGSLGIPETDWMLILSIPYKDIDAFGERIRVQMLIVTLVILPLLLPLSFWFASTGTRRLSRLITGARLIQKGEIDIHLPVEGKDEIGELTDNFNRMTIRIRALLDEQYRSGQEIKNLELKSLQAQINPHFLYNTLDLINFRALKSGNADIVETVDALARFYRLSLSGGRDTVTIAQEVEHATAYLRIQNMRFDQAVHLKTDIPEDIGRLSILKIVLQPLVENSILHGILESEKETGTIGICAWREGDKVFIEVEDDGAGMASERLEQMFRGEFTQDAHRSEHGYGVRNIHDRIKLTYGESYGLSYSSTLGKGTVVRITIPFLEDS